MRCENCKNKIDPSSTRCPICGKPVNTDNIVMDIDVDGIDRVEADRLATRKKNIIFTSIVSTIGILLIFVIFKVATSFSKEPVITEGDPSNTSTEFSDYNKLIKSQNLVNYGTSTYYYFSSVLKSDVGSTIKNGIYSLSEQGDSVNTISSDDSTSGIAVYNNRIYYVSDAFYSKDLEGENSKKLTDIEGIIEGFYMKKNKIYYKVNVSENPVKSQYKLISFDIEKNNKTILEESIEEFCIINDIIYILSYNNEDKSLLLKKSNLDNYEPEIIKLNVQAEDFSHISDFQSANNCLYFVFSRKYDEPSVLYMVDLVENNLENDNIKKISEGDFYNLYVYKENCYYFERDKEQLFNTLKLVKKDSPTKSSIIAYDVKEMFIDNQQIYTIYSYIQGEVDYPVIFRQDLDGANKELIFNFFNLTKQENAYELIQKFVDTNLKEFYISHIKDEYIYFLGGFVKNDGTKISLIEPTNGNKESYSFNMPSNKKTKPWQDSYIEFLYSENPSFDKTASIMILDMNNDSVPELFIESLNPIGTTEIYSFVDNEVISVGTIDSYISTLLYNEKNKMLYYYTHDDSGEKMISSKVDGLSLKKDVSFNLDIFDSEPLPNMITHEQRYTKNATPISFSMLINEFREIINTTTPLEIFERSPNVSSLNLSAIIYLDNEQKKPFGELKNIESNIVDIIEGEHFAGGIVEDNNLIYFSTNNGIYLKDLRTYLKTKIVTTKNIKPDDFFLRNDYLYFSTTDGFYRIKTNGTALEKLLPPGYRELNMTDDSIYFFKSSNGVFGTLCKYDFLTKTIYPLFDLDKECFGLSLINNDTALAFFETKTEEIPHDIQIPDAIPEDEPLNRIRGFNILDTIFSNDNTSLSIFIIGEQRLISLLETIPDDKLLATSNVAYFIEKENKDNTGKSKLCRVDLETGAKTYPLPSEVSVNLLDITEDYLYYELGNKLYRLNNHNLASELIHTAPSKGVIYSSISDKSIYFQEQETKDIKFQRLDLESKETIDIIIHNIND